MPKLTRNDYCNFAPKETRNLNGASYRVLAFLWLISTKKQKDQIGYYLNNFVNGFNADSFELEVKNIQVQTKIEKAKHEYQEKLKDIDKGNI